MILFMCSMILGKSQMVPRRYQRNVHMVLGRFLDSLGRCKMVSGRCHGLWKGCQMVSRRIIWAGKVSYGLKKVSDGLKKVSDGLGNVLYGLGKVSCGLGKDSYCLRRVSEEHDIHTHSVKHLHQCIWRVSPRAGIDCY